MFQSGFVAHRNIEKHPPQLKPTLTLKGFSCSTMSHIATNPMGCLSYFVALFASLIAQRYNSNI